MPDPALTFLEDYFYAWSGSDLQGILSFYSDDIRMLLPAVTLAGKPAVRDRFVRPFLAAFPDSIHTIRSWIAAENLLAVEWSLDRSGGGDTPVRVSGCSFYVCDVAARIISVVRLYIGSGYPAAANRLEGLIGSGSQ